MPLKLIAQMNAPEAQSSDERPWSSKLRWMPLKLKAQMNAPEAYTSDECPWSSKLRTRWMLLQQVLKPSTTSCSAVPHPKCFEKPHKAQSNGCPHKALRNSWDTVADCGLCLTHRTESLAWPGMQKKIYRVAAHKTVYTDQFLGYTLHTILMLSDLTETEITSHS